MYRIKQNAVTNINILLVDISIFLFIYLVPTISHMTMFPLYILDPMRWCVLGSLLILNNKRNAYILALTLPVFSFLVASHPILYKNVIISIELLFNILVFFYLSRYLKQIFWSMAISIVLSKILYYIMKYGLIITGLLEVEIFDTPISVQLGVCIVISVLFTIFNKKTLWRQLQI